MLFFAGLAAILVVFALGVLWPHKTPVPLGAAIWGYFVKALFIAWIWFLISFRTGLGAGAQFISLALLAAVVFSLFKRPPAAATTPTETGRMRFTRPLLVAALTLAIVWPALTSFGSIFSMWDAVVSWNRWGIELADNEYAPLHAAYPILWPAMWSLIYEAQGTSSYWFAAKASIAAPLLFAGALLTDGVRRPHILSGVVLCALVALSFSIQRDVVSGYMDLPLALIGLAALFLLVMAIDERDDARRRELFFLAVVTSAIAMVTKQAGIIFAGIVGLASLYEVFRSRISKQRLGLFGLIVFFPLASFLAIYFGMQRDAFGNWESLNAVAASSRRGAGVYDYAAGLFRDAFPVIVWPILVVGIALNVVFVRSYRGVIGMISLMAGIAVFILFANCCAYGIRNGYLVMSFAMISAFIGYSSAETKLAQRHPILAGASASEHHIQLRAPILAILGVSLVALAALSLAWPAERIAAYDRALRIKTLGREFPNRFLMDNVAEIEKAELFVSAYAVARYLPVTDEKFMPCARTDAICIGMVKARSDASEVLIFSMKNFENDESMAFIDAALKKKRARIVARRGPLTLYLYKIE